MTESLDLMAELETVQAKGQAEFERPRFTLGAITGGLGIPEATVRNWLTLGKLDLGASQTHQRGKWRLFSVRDALVISTCHYLSRLGVPVSVFAMVYEKTVGLGRMYFCGPVAMVRRPIGILFNDEGEWRLEKGYDSGPLRATNVSDQPAFILIDFDKIVTTTLAGIGRPVKAPAKVN